MSRVTYEDATRLFWGRPDLTRGVKCLVPSFTHNVWILHRHRAGARKVRRVLRRHQQRVRAGWVVSAHEWAPEELS